MRNGWSRWWQGRLGLFGAVVLCLLAIALGEWLPPMAAVQRWQAARPATNRLLLWLTGGMAVAGILLLALTQFLVRVPEPGRPRPAAAKGVVKGPGRFFAGLSYSAGFSDEARKWRVKKAFRDGEWWRAPRWRRMTLMMLGAILLFYGLFGLLFLLSPAGVKFLLALVAAYATARTAYAFATDRPFRR
jgi:hypothetical protein